MPSNWHASQPSLSLSIPLSAPLLCLAPLTLRPPHFSLQRAHNWVDQTTKLSFTHTLSPLCFRCFYWWWRGKCCCCVANVAHLANPDLDSKKLAQCLSRSTLSLCPFLLLLPLCMHTHSHTPHSSLVSSSDSTCLSSYIYLPLEQPLNTTKQTNQGWLHPLPRWWLWLRSLLCLAQPWPRLSLMLSPPAFKAR